MATGTLREDHGIPLLGFGTYGRLGPEGIDAILYALEVGYRHLDTAQDYGTEITCGEALRRSGLERDDVFVTTKVDTRHLGASELVPSVRKSLDTLGLDRLDLTLIHWPSPDERVPLGVYMEQIAEAQALGLTRLIGVSNFPIALLEESEALIGPGKIANNQVELNPHLQNRKLAAYCRAHGISVTCYLPIARGRLRGDPVIAPVARRHDASEEQIALAFERSKGLIAIPTSGRRDRILSNYRSLEIELAPDEITAIEAIDRNERQINPGWGPRWD